MDGLLPCLSYRDEVDRAGGEFFQSSYILASLRWQLLILSNMAGGGLPAGQFFIDRLTPF